MISYSISRIYGRRVRKGVYCGNEQFDDVRNCDLVVSMSYKNKVWQHIQLRANVLLL